MMYLVFALALTSGCSSLFYQGDRNLYFKPESLGFKHEDVFFQASDGTNLHGWLFHAQGKPVGTIIQFHGNAQNISSHYTSLVWLTQKGYNLFTFDYRGYGRSEGDTDPEGTHLDGLAALHLAHKIHRKLGGGNFILYGQSLGGVVGLRAWHDFKDRDAVDLIVMDSTFVSYQDMAAGKLRGSWLTWIFSPLAYLLVSDRYASEPIVPEVKKPMLVIHDKLDEIVEYVHGRKLYELATTEKKELWDYSYGSHIAVFVIDEKNRERFLEKAAAMVGARK